MYCSCGMLIGHGRAKSVRFLYDNSFTLDDLIDWLRTKLARLISARPAAVNLRNALKKLLDYAESIKAQSVNNLNLIERLTNFCLDAIKGGRALNKRLGDYGAQELIKLSKRADGGVAILTHCNTDALATVGYGTALGVVRSLRNKGRLMRVYCTETRLYNQGSRLTAWELVKEKMPATLIADSMAAYLMATKIVDAIIVGADCVAANGDTANKIGTLQLAVVAKHYKVPFFVAAPTQSFDLSIENQNGIKIELRPSHELRRIDDIVLAPNEIDVWNPCFDVTPSELITGITEYGVCDPNQVKELISKYVDHGDRNENIYAPS